MNECCAVKTPWHKILINMHIWFLEENIV